MLGAGIMGVILAAGSGARMHPVGEHYPKALLPVCGRPLIVHQLDVLRSVGVREVVVVIGYRGYDIASVIGDGSRHGVRVRYVNQPHRLGVAHALGHVEHLADRPLLVLLGDVFFVPGNLALMIDRFVEQGDGAVLCVKDEPDVSALRANFAVELGRDGHVRRVIEKPREATSRLRGVGVYLFGRCVFDAIGRTPRTAMRDEYEITHTIQVMIDSKRQVTVEHAVLDAVNINSPADLLCCNMAELSRRSESTLIGDRAEIHPGATLVRCVIGANAVIASPIELRDCVVFDNTVVESADTLDHCLFAPNVSWACGVGRGQVRENHPR